MNEKNQCSFIGSVSELPCSNDARASNSNLIFIKHLNKRIKDNTTLYITGATDFKSHINGIADSKIYINGSTTIGDINQGIRRSILVFIGALDFKSDNNSGKVKIKGLSEASIY